IYGQIPNKQYPNRFHLIPLCRITLAHKFRKLHNLCNFIISSSWQINPDKFFILVEHVIFSAALPYMDKSLTSITGRGSISSLSAGLHKLLKLLRFISYIILYFFYDRK